MHIHGALEETQPEADIFRRHHTYLLQWNDSCSELAVVAHLVRLWHAWCGCGTPGAVVARLVRLWHAWCVSDWSRKDRARDDKDKNQVRDAVRVVRLRFYVSPTSRGTTQTNLLLNLKIAGRGRSKHGRGDASRPRGAVLKKGCGNTDPTPNKRTKWFE